LSNATGDAKEQRNGKQRANMNGKKEIRNLLDMKRIVKMNKQKNAMQIEALVNVETD
jgi:hypothetical protein